MSKKKPAPKGPQPKQAEGKKPPPRPSSKNNTDQQWKQWFVFAFLAALTFLVFYPSLKCEFTNWDDGTYVTENPMIWKLDGETVKNIFINPGKKDSDPWYMYFTPVSLNYHPLTMLSLAVDHAIDGLNPYYYHLNNVIIHILNVLLVFVFIRMFTEGYNRRTAPETFRPDPFTLALITAAFWAIHPMRVESVTWVAERKDVLYVFFFFLSAIFYLRWLDSKKISLMIWCFIFFVCSCLSKGMGVVLPVVLVLIDWFYGEAGTTKQFFQSILKKAHFFAASLVFGIIAFRIQSQGAIASMETFSFFQRLTFGCYGFIMYVKKMFLPVDLSAFYPYPFTDAQGNIPSIYYASPFIVLALALTIFFLLWKKTPAGKVLAFGFAFYFTTIVLVLQFLSVGSVIMADRYAYLSYTGLFFMIGYFFEYVKKYFSSTASGLFLAVLVVAAGYFSYSTYLRTYVWTNAKTLWTDAMKQYPFIEIAYENRGIYFKDHGQLDSMLLDYEFVTEKLHSKNPKIWSNLGNLYGLLGQKKDKSFFDRSLNAYSEAIKYNPGDASTYLNRAITHSMMGNYKEALPDFDKSLQLSPDVALTYKNRAWTQLQLGKNDASISDYDNAIRLYAYDTVSYLNRGIAKFNAKKYAESLVDFQKYISLVPANAQAYYNASMAAKNTGRFPEALQYAEKALALKFPVTQQYIDELRSKAKPK